MQQYSQVGIAHACQPDGTPARPWTKGYARSMAFYFCIGNKSFPKFPGPLFFYPVQVREVSSRQVMQGPIRQDIRRRNVGPAGQPIPHFSQKQEPCTFIYICRQLRMGCCLPDETEEWHTIGAAFLLPIPRICFNSSVLEGR